MSTRPPRRCVRLDRAVSRRQFLAGTGVVGITTLAGCAGQISECEQTRLKEERKEGVVASVDAAEYTNEIELTLNFWDQAGTEENPAERVHVFNNKGESVGTFRVKAASTSATARVEKDELKPAYVQVYGDGDHLLETRSVEVRCE